MKEEKPLIIAGKTYISARRAASISGYTTDYLGQLCRSDKLLSTMVGRNRFIDYSSLRDYIDTPREVIVSPATTQSAPAIQGKHRASLRDALPVLAFGLLLATVASMTSPEGDSQTSRIAEKNSVELKQSAIALDSVLEIGERADRYYIGALENAQDYILDLASVLRARMLALLGPIIGNSVSKQLAIQTATTTVVVPSLTEEQVRALARDVVRQEVARLAPQDGGQIGLVVRGKKENENEQQIKQSIRDSFSDEVIVTLDESRGAGIIRPIFRNATDDSYVFVIVPIRP